MEVETSTKKAKMQIDPASPGHRHPKSYSDLEKELVVKADMAGGRPKRLEMAQMLGMPEKTADHIVYNFRHHKRNAIHDARHDPHFGRNAKYDSNLIREVLEWFHYDAKVTLKEIREHVNAEIFRKILLEEHIPLPAAERHFDVPINNPEQYLQNDNVKAKFEKQHVESDSTIAHWMDGLVMSRKHVLEMGECDATRSARLVFAKDMLAALEDPNSVIVFIDEIPFFLDCHNPPGHEHGAVNERYHFEVQAQIAVDPLNGVFHTGCYAPHHPHGEHPHGITWNEPSFKKFLNEVIAHMMGSKDSYRNKNVYIVANCPVEYFANITEHHDTLPAVVEMLKFLKETNNRCSLIKQPANTPCFNLGEFYNRDLRNLANFTLFKMRTDPEAKDQVLHGLGKEHAHKCILEKILRQSMGKLQSVPAQPPALVKMTADLKEIIEKKGLIDPKKIL